MSKVVAGVLHTRKTKAGAEIGSGPRTPGSLAVEGLKWQNDFRFFQKQPLSKYLKSVFRQYLKTNQYLKTMDVGGFCHLHNQDGSRVEASGNIFGVRQIWV